MARVHVFFLKHFPWFSNATLPYLFGNEIIPIDSCASRQKGRRPYHMTGPTKRRDNWRPGIEGAFVMLELDGVWVACQAFNLFAFVWIEDLGEVEENDTCWFLAQKVELYPLAWLWASPPGRLLMQEWFNPEQDVEGLKELFLGDPLNVIWPPRMLPMPVISCWGATLWWFLCYFVEVKESNIIAISYRPCH